MIQFYRVDFVSEFAAQVSSPVSSRDVNAAGATLFCSADFQSALSPNCIRQAVRNSQACLEWSSTWQISTLRYGIWRQSVVYDDDSSV